MTPAERKKRFDALSRIGCIACHNNGTWSEAHMHHAIGLKFRATGKKASDENVIPLCPQHHQLGGYGVAIHAGVKAWESIHGTQEELLAQINSLLCELESL